FMSRVIVFSIAVISLSILVLAQTPQQTPPPGDIQKQGDKGGFVIRTDTTLIQVPVSVHDREGRPVNNLSREQFQVFEDKVPQQIKLFVHEDVPISLGLVIDNSGSMRSKQIGR